MGCDSSKLLKNHMPQKQGRNRNPVIDSSKYIRNDDGTQQSNNIFKKKILQKKNEQKTINSLKNVLDQNIIDFAPRNLDIQNVIRSSEQYKRKQNEKQSSRNRSDKTIKNQFDPYQLPQKETSEKLIKQKSLSPRSQGNDFKLESFKDIKPIYSIEQFQKEVKSETKQQENIIEEDKKSQNKEKMKFHRRASSMNETKTYPKFQLKKETAQVEVIVKEGTKEYNNQMKEFKSNKAELQQNYKELQENMIQNLLDLQIKQYEQVEQIQNAKAVVIEEAELQKDQWKVIVDDQTVKIEQLESQKQLLKQEQISLESKHKENISSLYEKLNMSVAQLSQKKLEFESIKKQHESRVSRSTEHTSHRNYTEMSELDTTVNTMSESIWIEKDKHESAFVNLQRQLKVTMQESEVSIKKIQSQHKKQIEKVKLELQEELNLEKVRSSKIIEKQQNQIMQLKQTSDLYPSQKQKLQRASVEKNILQQQLQRALEELEKQQQEINQLRNSQKSFTLSPNSKASESPSIQLSPIEYQRTKKFFQNPQEKEIKQ